nr:hypothetical protein [Tanacetum cinerariifolium]
KARSSTWRRELLQGLIPTLGHEGREKKKLNIKDGEKMPQSRLLLMLDRFLWPCSCCQAADDPFRLIYIQLVVYDYP